MRKITFEASKALMGGYNYKSANTIVDGILYDGSSRMLLHRNEIARFNKNVLSITNAGWSSSTTKERLNGLPGVHIVQKAGVWYLNGIEWNGAWVTLKENGAWSY